MNRSLSVRSKKGDGSTSTEKSSAPRHRFTISTLRGLQQPDLSKKLYKLIKSENHAISAYETAARERASVAEQLSAWGESTGDDAISDLSDKLGVLLAEIAEQEEVYAANLEEYRAVLKGIRDCEAGVQPSRDHKSKVADEIQKLKYKEPTSTKIEQLEQELVRAEAQSLVAEAQLTNITRQKFKAAHDVMLRATIERAEKQVILARHAQHIVGLLDDTPIVPGDVHPAWDSSSGADIARQIINEAEEDLRSYQNREQEAPRSQPRLSGGVSSIDGSTTARSVDGDTDVHPALRQRSPEGSVQGSPTTTVQETHPGTISVNEYLQRTAA